MGHFHLGEHPGHPGDPFERAFVPDIFSLLGIFLPGWLWPKFDIDHASDVSFYVSMVSMGELSPLICADGAF
jgi:hypothetical protein